MDAVSRDALTETEQTLNELAGFLRAVKTAPEGGSDPALDETAIEILGLAERLRVFVLGEASRPKTTRIGQRECEAAANVAGRSITKRQHLRSVPDQSTMPDLPALV